MGGFLAIVMSHFIPIKTVIAFAPQYSVDPADVPWETRWKKYTCDIPEYRVKNAASHMNAQTSYFLFTSDTLLDKQQAELFPVGENLLHYNFSGSYHKVAALLKEKGLLGDLIETCLEGRAMPDIEIDYIQLSPAVP